MSETRTGEPLSAYLARRIFQAPYACTRGETVDRIQFRGPQEQDMGGFCEKALRAWIAGALKEYPW